MFSADATIIGLSTFSILNWLNPRMGNPRTEARCSLLCNRLLTLNSIVNIFCIIQYASVMLKNSLTRHMPVAVLIAQIHPLGPSHQLASH
jgi:hypothetical protein